MLQVTRWWRRKHPEILGNWGRRGYILIEQVLSIKSKDISSDLPTVQVLKTSSLH